MALIFECIQTDGIAELSYLIGDDSEGVAAVFDPRPDVACYLQFAVRCGQRRPAQQHDRLKNLARG